MLNGENGVVVAADVGVVAAAECVAVVVAVAAAHTGEPATTAAV